MTQDRTFTKIAKKMGDKVGENPAALRAAVFLCPRKTAGGVQTPPPPAENGLFIGSSLTYITFFNTQKFGFRGIFDKNAFLEICGVKTKTCIKIQPPSYCRLLFTNCFHIQ